jgi:hypothetical protein
MMAAVGPTWRTVKEGAPQRRTPLRGFRETEQFEAIQQSAAGYQAVRNL